MSVFILGDTEFTESNHPDFGERLFTIKHSAKEAKAILWVGIVLSLATLIVFAIAILGNEMLLVVGICMMFFGPLSILLGVSQLLRARRVFHVHDTGITEEIGEEVNEMAYGLVTDSKLDYMHIRGRLTMKFTLSCGVQAIHFKDDAVVGRFKNEGRMHEMVQYIVDELPEKIEIRGTHRVQRSTD